MRNGLGMVLLALTACSQGGGTGNEAATSRSTATEAGSSVATAGSSGDGPFGLVLSTPFDKLNIDDANERPESGVHMLKSVPSPSSDFESVAVVAFPETGICEIRSLGPDISNDALGGTIRSKIDELGEALEAKYGHAKKSDDCAGGEVFCDSSNWTYALGSGMRMYAYEWPNPDGSSKIRNIALYAAGKDIGTSYVRLDYEVNDAAACSKAQKAARAGRL